MNGVKSSYGKSWIVVNGDKDSVAIWTHPIASGVFIGVDYSITLRVIAKNKAVNPQLTITFRSKKKKDLPEDVIINLTSIDGSKKIEGDFEVIHSIVNKDYASFARVFVEEEDLTRLFKSISKLSINCKEGSLIVERFSNENLSFAQLKEAVAPNLLSDEQKYILQQEHLRLEEIAKLYREKAEKEEERERVERARLQREEQKRKEEEKRNAQAEKDRKKNELIHEFAVELSKSLITNKDSRVESDLTTRKSLPTSYYFSNTFLCSTLRQIAVNKQLIIERKKNLRQDYASRFIIENQFLSFISKDIFEYMLRKGVLSSYRDFSEYEGEFPCSIGSRLTLSQAADLLDGKKTISEVNSEWAEQAENERVQAENEQQLMIQRKKSRRTTILFVILVIIILFSIVF